MNNQNDRSEGLSGRELQQSQSGGGSGEFGGNRNQQQGGGSQSSPGYGKAQNQENHRGQQKGSEGGNQDRGAAFDEQQGGGRGTEDLDQPEASDEFNSDQQAHQDRGQGAIEAEHDRSS